jgi:hypothetical protein
VSEAELAGENAWPTMRYGGSSALATSTPLLELAFRSCSDLVREARVDLVGERSPAFERDFRFDGPGVGAADSDFFVVVDGDSRFDGPGVGDPVSVSYTLFNDCQR